MHSDPVPGSRAPAVAPATLVPGPAGSRSDAGGVPLARAPPSHGPPDLTVEEWDELFEAVRMRLEHAVAAMPASEGTDIASRADVDVRECVEALGQLQMLMAPERERRLRQELQVIELRRALALAIAELIDVAARILPSAATPTLTASDH